MSAPEPPVGRFPTRLLPRAAGHPRKLNCHLSGSSLTLAKIVGREWKFMNPGGSSNFSGSPFSAGTHPGLASRVGIAAFGRSSRRLGTGRRIGPNRLGDPVGSSVRCSSLHNPVPSIRSANREHVHRSSDSDVTRYRSSGRCSNEHSHILSTGYVPRNAGIEIT